jgi:hypothetical protein
LGWGFVECFYSGRVLDSINVERDAGLAISRRLNEIDAVKGEKRGSVIVFYEWLGDDLAGTIPQPNLWSLHQNTFGSIPFQKSKERYYQQIYFKNYDRSQLANKLSQGDPLATMALFDAGRVNSYLTSEFSKLSQSEIGAEADAYERYASCFEPQNSPDTILSYAVVPRNRPADLTRIDKWYVREELQVFEYNTLYRLTLRNNQ